MGPTANLKHCEIAELTCAYAVQALAPSEVAAAEAHIAACSDCQREVESLRPVVNHFVSWPTDVLRPTTSLQARLASRIAEETGTPPVPPPAPQWSEPEWEQVAPGIECKLLATDTKRDRVSMLVRLAPGARYPAHTHAAVEELHLLDGELWIDARKLFPADYNYGAPRAGDEHVWSETGCTCVLITSTKDVLVLTKSGETVMETLRNVKKSNGSFGEPMFVNLPSVRELLDNGRAQHIDLLGAPEALCQSARHFRDIIEAFPAAVYMTDAEGRLTYFNRAAIELSGRVPEMGTDHWCVTWKLYYPDGKPMRHDECPMAVCLRERRPILDAQAMAERPDGTRFWFQPYPTPLFDESGNLTGGINMLVDITERKNAEAQIRSDADALTKLNALSSRLWAMRSLREGLDEMLAATIDMLGADFGHIQLLNSTSGTLTIEAQRGFKQEFLDFFREVSASDDSACGRALRSGERIIVEDVEMDAPFAPMLHVFRTACCRAVQYTPLIDRSGKPLGMISTHFRSVHRPGDQELRRLDLYARQASDFVERCRADEDLKQAREAAETANRLKDEFLATVSHELRTPLNAIMGWTHLLLTGGKLDAETSARGLETIARNAAAQNQLISDLLDMSRVVSGQLRFESGVVDLVRVIEAASETVRPAADAKRIVLHLKLEQGAGLVSGDSMRLQQIVWNLLSNAVKFTPKGGQVTVRLKRESSSVVLIVSDTGEGISAEFLPCIFDRFRQAESTTKRQHSGLGLGLAIVRHLVEAHGGTIRASSKGVGKGATFTVMFPLLAVHRDGIDADGASFPVASAISAPSATLKGVRVLVIDDEEDARELLTLTLTQSGAEVRTAPSVRAALDILDQWKPNVLVSDIGMPGEDGYDLIRTVRARESERGGTVPALALTGYASAEDAARARVAGYQTHMAKPVTPSDLVVAVASLVAEGSVNRNSNVDH